MESNKPTEKDILKALDSLLSDGKKLLESLSREPKKEKPLPLTDEEIIKIREFLASHALFIQKH